MGCVPNIDANTFPKQSSYLGKRVKVVFHYDTSTVIGGEMVRDDVEDPYVGIIKLDDGRCVLITECQWSAE